MKNRSLFNPLVILGLLSKSIRELCIFGGFAAAGGALFGLFTAFFPEPRNRIESYLDTAIEVGFCGAGIAIGLFIAGLVARRAKMPGVLAPVRALGSGLLVGAISGDIGQLLYDTRMEFDWIKHIVLRSSAWALMGAVLGLLLAYTVPNLGRLRGTIAGAVGGALGAAGFIVVVSLFPDWLARVVGFAAIGLAFGFCMITVDALLREASLQIIWGGKESTMLSLGQEPISIGGGRDTVYVSGYPPNVALVRFQGGKVQYVETSTQKVTDLRNGSRIKLGNLVEIVIHARA